MLSHQSIPPKPEKCEICDTNPTHEYYMRIWCCEPCAAEQRAVTIDNKAAIARNEVTNRIQYAKPEFRSDIFNAQTASINEIREMIASDDRITNKEFKLAEILKEMIENFQKVIYEKTSEVIDLNTKQRASQDYLNTLANKLRSEEREKLRIADKNYKPVAPRLVKAKTIKRKIDTKEIKECIDELNKEFPEMNMTEPVFRMIMAQKKRGPKDTLYDLRSALKSAKSVNSDN